MDITLYANAKTLDNDAIIRTFTFYHGKRHITISTRIPHILQPEFSNPNRFRNQVDSFSGMDEQQEE